MGVVYRNLVRAQALFLFALLAVSCGSSSPSQPTPAAAYQGAWGGTFVIEQATPFPSSSYQHMCNDSNYVAGTAIGVSMTIAQNGPSLVGQYTAGGTTTTFVSLLNGDGSATVTGSSTSSVYRYDYTFRLNPPVSSRIAGTVSLSRTGSAGLVGGCAIESRSLSLQQK